MRNPNLVTAVMMLLVKRFLLKNLAELQHKISFEN